MKFIPKKYMQNLELVEKDLDGYWGYSKKGYKFENTGCHTAHGVSQKEFMEDIRSMTICECERCK